MLLGFAMVWRLIGWLGRFTFQYTLASDAAEIRLCGLLRIARFRYRDITSVAIMTAGQMFASGNAFFTVNWGGGGPVWSRILIERSDRLPTAITPYEFHNFAAELQARVAAAHAADAPAVTAPSQVHG